VPNDDDDDDDDNNDDLYMSHQKKNPVFENFELETLLLESRIVKLSCDFRSNIRNHSVISQHGRYMQCVACFV
jgi:hypothetical protein